MTTGGTHEAVIAVGPEARHPRMRRAGEMFRTAAKSPTTVAGALVLLLICLMAIFAPLIVEANSPDPSQLPRDFSALNAPPGTPGHPLGTTAQGGDVLYGVVWGSRTSVTLALVVVTATTFIGVLIGSLAAVLGGKWDEYLMRLVDLFMSIPELILALAIAGVLGPSFRNIVLALIITGWTDYARLIRGEILHVKQLEYVESARVLGDKGWRIYLKDVLPNSFTPIIVMITLDLGKVVLVGATLSFIGLAEVGLAEWGNLVSAGQEGVITGAWWVATFGGGMVFLWALASNLLGDGLRDVFDPRTETR
jgi:peptide/nickel transport system permease protein